jgi:hypothetical protein
MIGSVTRKSECITAVMVLVAANAGLASAAESAMEAKVNFDVYVERSQRGLRNIRSLLT